MPSIMFIRLFWRHFDDAGITGSPDGTGFLVELPGAFCPVPDVLFFQFRIDGNRNVIAFRSGRHRPVFLADGFPACFLADGGRIAIYLDVLAFPVQPVSPGKGFL